MPPHIFTIELAALSDEKYQITARPPSSGSIQVVVRNPIRSREVEAYSEILTQHKHNITPLEQAKATRQLGQKLFNFLLKAEATIYDAYVSSLNNAGANGLRLVLEVENAGALAHLPWEVICDPERDFLALSAHTSIARATSTLEARSPIPLLLPLRVLVITATRNTEHEWRQLREATGDLQRSGQIELDRLYTPSMAALRRSMLAQDYHVIHYIGSALVNGKDGQPALTMLDKENDTVNTDALSHELYPESTVRLLLLTPDTHSCAAATLVASKVRLPATLTLQFPVSRTASVLFMREFFAALLHGVAVDSAVSRGRRAAANRLQTGEWAAPVLFAHPRAQVLFRPLARSTKHARSR